MWYDARDTEKLFILGLNKSPVDDSLFDLLNVHGTTGFFQHNLRQNKETHFTKIILGHTSSRGNDKAFNLKVPVQRQARWGSASLWFH